MWWPITGKIEPEGRPLPGDPGRPCIDTGRFDFRALPADIEVLNRRAVERGDLDITALSVRCYADVKDRYAITACGASFGDGFGPKLVCRDDSRAHGLEPFGSSETTIAVPGRRTTAFLMLGMVLGPAALHRTSRFIEMPFDRIIGAVAAGTVDAGLVIHEGQLTFGDAGLRLVTDVGAWWKEKTGLKLPLGINAVRRGLEQRHGPGTLRGISDTLTRSVAHAMQRRRESVEYTMAFAYANVARGGGLAPTLERVDRYCAMYVSDDSVNMGDAGREAIARLLAEGSRLGLCPDPGEIDLV
jgi:1,4-dihydroxy-6-naphthoate synthase